MNKKLLIILLGYVRKATKDSRDRLAAAALVQHYEYQFSLILSSYIEYLSCSCRIFEEEGYSQEVLRLHLMTSVNKCDV
jgi:hypothetical protein